jgi:trans-aconitate methyltransferase
MSITSTSVNIGARSPSLARRVVWRLARSIGGRFEQWVWNDQYRRGRWNNLDAQRDPVTVAYVERLAKHGAVIELGCGTGTLATTINPQAYSKYIGYDLSEVAIERARAVAAQRCLSKCTFIAGDMATWEGSSDLALIVIEEALMYLPPADQESLLRKCLSSLKPGGYLLVTAHSAEKHRSTLRLCRDICQVVEEVVEGRVHLVLQARP